MKTLIMAFGLLLSTSALSQLSAIDIMSFNDQQRKVQDETVNVEMLLINKGGSQRKRAIKIITQTNAENIQNSLIKFSSPQNISGTGLLTVEKVDSNDDQWLYLPALKRSRRISAANQSDSFMGTDFSYEDLGAENLADFNYELLGEEPVDGFDNFIIKAIPASQEKLDESGYGHRVLWIRKTDFIISKIDFFNKSNKLTKKLKADDIHQVASSNISRPKMVTMENIKTKHRTILSYENFKINTGLKSSQFTMRALERSW